MSRPGFMIEVDERTPALLTLNGGQLGLSKFGVGTRVVYAADATASTDPVSLIDHAVEAPTSGPELGTLMADSQRLTIVVLDSERPRPRMKFDVRRTIVERVLEMAAAQGVDDVSIVIAGGLNKRWNPVDMTRNLGDRVATSFLPDGRIESHDVTSEDLVEVGTVDDHPVRINRRVAESDFVVCVGVQFGRTPLRILAGSLADVETQRRLGAVEADESFAKGVVDTIAGAVKTYAIQAVLGQPFLAGSLRFASKREWEWSARDKFGYAATRQLGHLPSWLSGVDKLHARPVADYAVVDIVAGEPAPVFREAEQVWTSANAIEVQGQSDVLVTSVWAGSFDDGDPIGSPINAAHAALVRRAGSHLGTPFARDGGALIALHPLVPRFSNRRQSSAADFFAKVLSETTDPAEMGEAEQRACSDQWYLDLYRKQFADHPLRTFQTWYDVWKAAQRFTDIIWVGGNRRSADLFGHRAATTYADALELASNSVGHQPSITYLRGPGLPLGDVR